MSCRSVVAQATLGATDLEAIHPKLPSSKLGALYALRLCIVGVKILGHLNPRILVRSRVFTHGKCDPLNTADSGVDENL